jgi:hypothetical protein
MNSATAKSRDKGAGVATTSLISGSEPVKLLRRIGSTTIEVAIHFSNTSKETLEDKLLRMIDREVGKSA